MIQSCQKFHSDQSSPPISRVFPVSRFALWQFRSQACFMKLVRHILLCLVTLLRISGVSADCVYACCSVSLSEQSTCCPSDGCTRDCPSSPKEETPCDSPCCVAQEFVLLATPSSLDDASSSSLVCSRVDDAPLMVQHRSHTFLSTTPSRGVRTHLLMCVLLC